MLKNRKTSNGQGQMVPREIITQTQEARTLKETENWAWTIFQLINCWNGANSTSGPAFIKLQGWVTLTSYCLSPWLSDQNREPIPQQAVSSSAAPSTQTPQAAPGFPSKIYHHLCCSKAQQPRSWNPGGNTSLHRPNRPWDCCCSCSLIPPRCPGDAALWQCWGMSSSFHRTAWALSSTFCDSDSSKSLWPGGPNKKHWKIDNTHLVPLSTFLGSYFPAGTDRIWVARSWDQA